ncbi:g1061 [Coccomyxa elongata]
MTRLLSPSSEGFSEQISALNDAMANPPPRPRMFGRSDVAPIADMTFQELDALLDLEKGRGMTPFINLFKLLHLNDDAPRNHNVLLESRDSALLVFKQRHWRRMEGVKFMLMQCLGNMATAFLDLEMELAENMDGKCFRRFMKLRDRVETMSIGYVRVSAETHKVLDRMRDAIVHFTARRPDLLAYAKADCQLAPPPVETPAVRDISYWQPGGSRYEAFRARRETYDIVPP